jgi:hypothetical protein
MLYSEVIAVCSEMTTKRINTLIGQNVELMNSKPIGVSSNQYAVMFKELRIAPHSVYLCVSFDSHNCLVFSYTALTSWSL